jgi:hypothetical protein
MQTLARLHESQTELERVKAQQESIKEINRPGVKMHDIQ